MISQNLITKWISPFQASFEFFLATDAWNLGWKKKSIWKANILAAISRVRKSTDHFNKAPILLHIRTKTKRSYQIRSHKSLSHVWLFATPWIAARQASLSITNSRSSLRLTSIESVMPSSHLILCCPLLLLPPIPPSISLFQWVNSSHEVAKVLEFQI